VTNDSKRGNDWGPTAAVVDGGDLAAWLTQIWDEDERLATDAALMSGWDGFGESRIASGSEWVASYHVVKRKRAEGEPLESRKGRELADCGNMNLERAKHIAHNDPASMLARIAANKEILRLHSGENGDPCQSWAGNYVYTPCSTLLALASPYAGRPGFRDEWR
jgi:hypothetical protein